MYICKNANAMKTLLNPFVTIGYGGSQYFCDRLDETQSIIRSIESGNSVTLTSIRRMGKTGLIRHVLAKLPKDYVGIYLDIQPAENLPDFLNMLSTALLKAVPARAKYGHAVWTFIKSLRPTISFEALSGLPQVTIDSRPRTPEPDIYATLSFLEKQPFRVVIAIDEFQQILQFPEKQTEAWLRSIIQQMKNLTFIFSGSQQHLMGEMFNSPSKPFFRSTQFMKMGRIPSADYRRFICRLFRRGGMAISEDTADRILVWCNHHTYYVQLLCNRLFTAGHAVIADENWQLEAQAMIRETETIFYSYRDLLTNKQWLVLKSIASEKQVYSPTSLEFLKKHNLGTSATVIQSLNALIKKEMVYKEFNSEGKSFYSVYDLLFQHWISREY